MTKKAAGNVPAGNIISVANQRQRQRKGGFDKTPRASTTESRLAFRCSALEYSVASAGFPRAIAMT